MASVIDSNDSFTRFWNDVLVAKFERFRNIMLDGLSYHSAGPLARLDLPRGARAVDVGCGWGDTAIELARKAGPEGSVLGLDCCDALQSMVRRHRRPTIAASFGYHPPDRSQDLYGHVHGQSDQ